MKNVCNRYRIILWAIIFCLNAFNGKLFAQCTTTHNSTGPTLPSCDSWATVNPANTNSSYTISVVPGGLYEFQTCGTSYNSSLTLRQTNGSGTLVLYDAGGQCSDDVSIAWTGTFTGTLSMIVNGDGCAWPATSSVLLYRQRTPNASTVSITNTSCTDYTLTASGGEGSFQWQQSTDNSTWSDVSGATGSTYTVPSTNVNSYFRVKHTAGSCQNFSGSVYAPSRSSSVPLTVTSSMTMAGTYNFGSNDFTVNSGVVITIPAGCELIVNANNITMSGTINGDAKGNVGGAGGGGGGGNSAGAGGNSGGGGRGLAGSGTGGGGNGNNGNPGGHTSIDCGTICISGHNGTSSGGSGGSSGGGGAYGGNGGGGGFSAAGVGGGDYPAPGAYVTAGSAGVNYGNGSDASAVTSGSGGSGGGGGGGGWQAGTSGGNGGRGGSAVSLIASANLTVSGNISVNGSAGGNGGNGGGLIDGSYNCSCINSGFIWQGASGCRDNSLCGACTYYTYPQTGGAGGGGGGGSGGGILLQGFGPVSVTGSLTANGGAGGAAVTPGPTQGGCVDYAQGGGGGGGGRIKIIRNPCQTNNIAPSTLSASAGAGGGAFNGNSSGASGGTGTTVTNIDHPSYSTLVAGGIGGAQTLCTGGVPTTLTTSSSASGGVGSYTYTWFSCAGAGCTTPAANTSPGAGWTNRGGGTGATTFTEGVLTQTTSYIRQVVSGGCIAYAGPITVTVNPDPVSQTIAGTPASGTTVCAGASISATFSGGSGGAVTVTDVYEYNTAAGVGGWTTYVPGVTTITASTAGTNQIQIRTHRTATGTDCNTSTDNIAMWSVVAAPVAQTISPTPASGTTICAGAAVSATFSGGAGGTGTVTDVYEYNTNAGAGGWTTYVPGTTTITASTAGTNQIQIRTSRTATGTGCTTSGYNTVMWSVVADPVSQTITGTPAAGSTVCVGASISATFTGGSGGSGTVTDVYEYNTAAGVGGWTTYVPGTTTITANTTGTNQIQIRTHRTATGTDCNTSIDNVAMWTVVAVPVAQTISPTPASGTTVCVGAAVSATFSGGSGGTGTVTDTYEYNTAAGVGGWTTYVPSTTTLTASTVGTNQIQIRTRRTATGTGCTTSGYNTVMWSVVADPVSQTITGTPASGTTVCAGASISATFSGGSGGSGTVTDVYEYNTAAGVGGWTTYVPGTTTITASTAGTNQIQIRTHRTATGTDCNTSADNVAMWTVVAAPVAQTIAATPASGTTVCVGAAVSATFSGGSGGTGTVTDVYEYNTAAGVGGWTTYVPGTTTITASTIGTNQIQIRTRRTATGTGCTAWSYNTVIWSVVADPVSQTITGTPASGTTVCSGAAISATFSGGSGGSGTVTDVYEYNTAAGVGGWTAYVPGTTTITASTAGTNQIQIRTHRTATGTDCNTSADNIAMWSVVADPVSQTIAASPASGSTLCTGGSVSATFTGGSGGTGTVADTYEYSTNTGSTWQTYTPGANITGTTAGAAILQVRTRRTATGNDCNTSSYNTATWDVVNDPGISITTPSQTTCTGMGLTLSSSTTGGTGTCTYKWQYRSPAGSGSWINLGTASTQATGTLSATTEYRVTRTCSGLNCDPSTSAAVTITITSTNTWTGAAGSGGTGFWDVAGNWSCGVVPTTAHNVIIPNTSVAPNQPQIRNQTTYGIAVCKSINLSTGAVLTTKANGLLKVNQ